MLDHLGFTSNPACRGTSPRFVRALGRLACASQNDHGQVRVHTIGPWESMSIGFYWSSLFFWVSSWLNSKPFAAIWSVTLTQINFVAHRCSCAWPWAQSATLSQGDVQIPAVLVDDAGSGWYRQRWFGDSSYQLTNICLTKKACLKTSAWRF